MIYRSDYVIKKKSSKDGPILTPIFLILFKPWANIKKKKKSSRTEF